MAEGLVAEGVSVRRGTREVVRDVTLRAEAGRVTAVLGPNGAGKSTLLRALGGLLPHHAGRVLLSGEPLSSLEPEERARTLSFVPQHSLLTAPVPVAEVVAQGRFPHLGRMRVLGPQDREAVADAMVQADVTHLKDRRFTQLSFGEQRRVLLARALATGADIILLDEPTASLDVGHALRLYRQLRTLAEAGRTLVVVLHQLDDVLRHTDDALLLHEGRACAHGPSAEVLSVERVREVYGVDLHFDAGVEFRLPGARP